MKFKNSIVYLFVMFIGISSVTAQEKVREHEKKNTVKINPLLLGHYQIYYERIFNEHNSISFSGAYSGITNSLYKSINDKSTSEEVKMKNWKIYAEHCYYFKGAPMSYFLGIFARYTTDNENIKAKTETENYDHTRTTNNTGLLKMQTSSLLQKSKILIYISKLRYLDFLTPRILLFSETLNIALGVVFGRQYNLERNLTLDWFIGGMGEYVSRTNLKFSDISDSKADYEKNILGLKNVFAYVQISV